MKFESDLRACPPRRLLAARAIAHRAVQLVTRAARANLAPEDDDSHSNLGWDRQTRQFVSQPIAAAGQSFFVTAGIAPLSIGLQRAEPLESRLLEGAGFDDASAWLDERLERNGLKPAGSVELPYELPAEVTKVETFRAAAEEAGLRALVAWFDLAEDVLTDFASSRLDLKPGPSAVRCWPHHFDIATYVSLEDGDAETARGVGVGMSPGDDSYDQPYFYVNPWPLPDAGDLPQLPPPGRWHTAGFVGAIATAEGLLGLGEPHADLKRFLAGAFDTASR